MMSDARRADLLTSTSQGALMTAGTPAGMDLETPAPEATQAVERRDDYMDDQEFEGVVRELIDNARSLLDDEVMPMVDRAWRYLGGEVDQDPMGLIGRNDETGEPVYEGSKAVLTECWDQVQTLIPDIYRVLAGSEEAVAFVPNGPEDTAYVEQANDYVRHLFWDRNEGEALIKDGLLEWMVKFAAYRVWRENAYREHVTVLEDLDETQVQALQQEQDLEIEALEPNERVISVPQLRPDGMVTYQPMPLVTYRAQVRYREPYGRTMVALIPQDELLIDIEAQSLDESAVLGIDCERRASELIAMGIDPETVNRLAGKGLRRGGRLYADDIRRNRSGRRGLNRSFKDTTDPALRWVRTVDARVMVDRDRDGIAEAWRVIAIGEPLEVVSAVEDPGSDAIVVGSPFPRPHEIIGEGIVERNIDLQEIGTSIVRRGLDNFGRAVNPRPAISGGGERAFDDIQSWYGGPIDLGTNGQISWLQVPFHGQEALALLSFFADRRTLRTGISPASQGLDPRALKGQTVEAAVGILAGPQSREEGYAREFALRIMRPLFKAILRITCQYQDREEVIRLRNKFVPVDPRGWNPDMDAAVEVGLGTGSRIERIMTANMVLQKQEQLATAQSPLFDVKLYRQALADLTHALGTKDDTRYFPDLEDEEFKTKAAQAEQAKQQQIAQTVQIQGAIKQAEEQAKAQADIAVEQAKAQLEQRQAQLEAMLKQQEQALEGRLEMMQLAQEQQGKAMLLRIEGMIEAQLLRIKGAQQGASKAQGNIERRT